MADLSVFRTCNDCLQVGGVNVGSLVALAHAEYKRAQQEHPENPAFHMRRMFYTGSPYGAEILQLAKETRTP
jgi:hypothetical protein